MTDGVIKGTGNSRYLKGPANAAALYPTFDSFRDAWAAGTLPIDLNGINPAGWETVGDKLGKATLLTDSLCTALGLPTTATPTQAMDKLRQLVNTAQTGVNNGVKIATGSYLGNGRSGPSYKNILTFQFTPKILIIKRNYIKGTDLSLSIASAARVDFGIFVNPSKSGAIIHSTSIYDGRNGVYVEWGNKSVTWFFASVESGDYTYWGTEQLNGVENGNPFDYYYVAIA